MADEAESRFNEDESGVEQNARKEGRVEPVDAFSVRVIMRAAMAGMMV
jgi:hypothetical protein